jgi:hypothetical protein
MWMKSATAIGAAWEHHPQQLPSMDSPVLFGMTKPTGGPDARPCPATSVGPSPEAASRLPHTSPGSDRRPREARRAAGRLPGHGSTRSPRRRLVSGPSGSFAVPGRPSLPITRIWVSFSVRLNRTQAWHAHRFAIMLGNEHYGVLTTRTTRTVRSTLSGVAGSSAGARDRRRRLIGFNR